MQMIIGLGNPGPKYAQTRHNIGFLFIDYLLEAWSSLASWSSSSEHQAEILKTKTFPMPGGEKESILLVKPQTFMNLSGESVQALMAFYKISLEQMLVIHDEVDIPFSTFKLQKNRGHGGHNGIRNIHDKVGMNYGRIKMGVGRPTIPQMSTADFVLQNFTSNEFTTLPKVFKVAAQAAQSFIQNGFERTQNNFNSQGTIT